MKILHLKYKMHKLVNLVFYLIIFAIGFLLGFSAQEINFNKLISQFLFIDNVNAYTITECQSGKNLFNKESITGGWIRYHDNYYLHQYTDTYSVTDYISVKPNSTYTINFIDSTGLDSAGIMEFDLNKYWLNIGFQETNQIITFTTSKNTHYIRFTVRNDSVDLVQLEVGNNATEYEPYSQICNEIHYDLDSFYSFSQKIFGEVNEENKFIYDFITFGLIVTCFTLFVLVVGYIFNKFFGG